MSGSWAGSMQAALAATAGRPRWWVLALAAFLVRGGIVVALLPLVTLPSAAALATAFAPTIESLALARQSAAAVLVGTALIGVVAAIVGLAAYVGSWLDETLVREAEVAEELDLRPSVAAPSAWRGLAIRFVAHLPTLLALAYATVRIVIVTYDEFLSPGDPGLPIAIRILLRAPDTVAVVGITWLLGEALGGLATRRAAEGEGIAASIRGAFRDLLARRGVATFVITDAVVFAVVLLLIAVVGRAATHLRAYLLDGASSTNVAAALLLLVATWVVGLAVLGAALAWRSTAWTIEAAPRRLELPVAAPTPDESPATGEAAAG